MLVPPPPFPPLPPLPPAHPRITALHKKIAASIATFARIAPPWRKIALVYLTAFKFRRQTEAQS
jgi:hypothetical protein